MRGMMAAGLGVCLTLAATLGNSRAQIEPLSVAATQANMGTGFTYQGRLTSSGAPVNGTCDFQFELWDASSGGTQIGTTLTKTNVSVTAGYFTIPDLDFGANAFNGQARWLAISVRCPAVSGGYYTALSPRQALTPAPHALALPGLWTQQNAVSPNLIGGHHANTVTTGAVGATIGGGGIGGYHQRVTDDYGTVGGGSNNQAGDAAGTTGDRPYATVAGGGGNVAGGYAATVGGGLFNTAAGMTATVSGGAQNTANGPAATVGGGRNNTAGANWATIGGGLSNVANANEAAIAGGWNNAVSGASGFIGGGGNTVSGPYATLGGGRLNVAGGAGAFVGGGGYDGTLTGGNRALGNAATIGGGISNTASADWSTIGGGYSNTVSANVAFVGGGAQNTANGPAATIGGGTLNTASGYWATIGGGYSNTANGSAATIGGGYRNTANGSAATIGGGYSNTVSADWSTIGGGYSNTANGSAATIGGGVQNTASDDLATIPGGYGAVANLHGQMAYASGYFSSPGDAQTSVYILRGTTDDSSSTASELFLDGSSERLTLPGRTIYFEAMIVGRDASGNSAGYRISGVVEDFGGTTAYVGAALVDLIREDLPDWEVSVTPTSSDASLRIIAISPGSPARWIAVVRTVELKNPS